MDQEYRNIMVRAEVRHLIRNQLTNLSDQLTTVARQLGGYPGDTVYAELCDALESDQEFVSQMINGYERILEEIGGEL